MANALFVCLHNAGRSQISQALFERAAEGRHRARSAGTTPGERVHPEVVEVMGEIGIDLADRVPHKLSEEDARWADVVVTMGCGDECPYIPGRRYLDWDPLLAEIKRVTKPGGKLLIIDMVTVPVAVREYPRLLKDKLRTKSDQKKNAAFDAALQRLVSHPDWKKMLEYNPIRSEHEMKWYLESRFPGQKMETLNMAWNSRIVAFDSGPVERGIEAKLSYP